MLHAGWEATSFHVQLYVCIHVCRVLLDGELYIADFAFIVSFDSVGTWTYFIECS